ncbi:hypothetical protein L6452_06080 [Arctium lappa]|uniref:Uncharacterized protein n=1 Tax=Arctium lappa TaxID=4217 RepID=A0ACB9EIE9_ARCLA|nr:hypothetical protein L6452_06080 [Arctium lappa]
MSDASNFQVPKSKLASFSNLHIDDSSSHLLFFSKLQIDIGHWETTHSRSHAQTTQTSPRPNRHRFFFCSWLLGFIKFTVNTYSFCSSRVQDKSTEAPSEVGRID